METKDLIGKKVRMSKELKKYFEDVGSIPELPLWNVWNADDEYPLDIQAELRKIAKLIKLIMLAFPEPAEEERDPGFDPIALGE